MIEPVVLQNLSQLGDAFAREGLSPALYQELVERVQRHFRRYTALESVLVGDVNVSFPEYLLGLDLPEDPLAAGEKLARLERERLGLGPTEAVDLIERIDRQGFKLYFPPFPPGDLAGFFLFDVEAGPCFVVDGTVTRTVTNHVLARLLHAFLTENDPYRIRLVLRGAAPAEATELRARAFAAAFLVSEEGIAAYLSAAGRTASDCLGADIVHQLAVFCEVDYQPLIARLLSLGRLTAAEIPPLLATLAADHPLDATHRDSGAVSERYLRLALESHARGDMDLDDLAMALETDGPGAAGLAARFRLEPPEEP